MKKARANRRASADRDNPVWTDKDFRRARPISDLTPQVIEAAKRARGRPKLAHPKKQVTLRIDAAALEAFIATGKGWQTRINDAVVRAARRRG
jgi:uncharacterized protein (DUF4415 family)